MSFQVWTHEIDDLEYAVSELKKASENFELLKNSCGIVMCSYETDVEELASRLVEVFDFPFIGCTGLGLLTSQGYEDECIVMTVMTADDCEFAVGLTGSIQSAEDLTTVTDTYKKLSARLPEKEKVIFSYVPWFPRVSNDSYVHTLNAAAGGEVPIFGGVASDGWTFEQCRTFCNGDVSDSSGAMLLVSGNVRPIIVTENSTNNSTHVSRKVTKSDGMIVYRMGDDAATDFFEKIGLDVSQRSVFSEYLGTPFLTTIHTSDGDEIDIIRCVGEVGLEDGACQFIGDVEEGSDVTMALTGKEEVKVSVRKVFDRVFERMEEEKKNGYNYGAIFCSSCVARYYLIVGEKQTEAQAYVGRLPEGVQLQGFYSFGEFCPVEGKKYKKMYNELHNETFTIIAI